MPSKIRIQRISGRIKELLSEMLIRDLQDPRLIGASVTDVTVDRELAFANIYVSCVEGHARAEEMIAGLESASGYIRSALARQIDLRSFPKLRFHYDPTPEQADHIEKLFSEIKAQEQALQEDNTEE
jgi:ribosome-binding factor A